MFPVPAFLPFCPSVHLESSTKEKLFLLCNVMINVILFFIQRQILAVFEERLQAAVLSDDSVLQKYHKVSS